MPQNRLLAIVTMALLLGPTQSMGQQAASLQELYAIESLIGGKDCRKLYSFLTARTHLVTGGDALAIELRNFMRDVEAGRLDCFQPRRARAAAVPAVGQVAQKDTTSFQFGEIY